MHCKPTNGVAAIFTTLQCPLACPDCSVRANRNNQRVAFDGKAAIHFLDQLKLRGWHHLTITGGEPTLIGYRLAWLVDRAHERGFRVMVQSNGYNVKELAAYGCADVISLTHYGAINRHDLRHLKKQDGPFGRRVRIKWAEHRPFFGEPVDNALPADCKCSGYMLFGDRLHGCGIQAARGLTQGISVYDDWSTLPDPRNETCCSGCLANVKSRRHPNGSIAQHIACIEC